MLRVRLGCASSALLLFLIILNKQGPVNQYYKNALRFLEAHCVKIGKDAIRNRNKRNRQLE